MPSLIANLGLRISSEYGRWRGSRLVRYATWLLAGQGANVLAQLAYYIALGRLLGSTQFGIFSAAWAMASLFSMFGALGSGGVLLRHVGRRRSLFPVYWGNLLLTCALSGSLVVALLAMLAHRLLPSEGASLVWMAGVANIVCGDFIVGVMLALRALERMKISAAVAATMSLLRLVAAAGMLFSLGHAGARQWAWAAMTASILGAILCFTVVTALEGWPRFRFGLLRLHLFEGLAYSLGHSGAEFSNNLDKAMLGHYGFGQANGIYSCAYRAIDMATLPVLAARDASTPRLFQLGASQPREMRRLTVAVTLRCAAYSVLAAAALWAGAGLLPWLVGPSFAESVRAVHWLCLMPLLRSLQHPAGHALLSMGAYRYRMRNQLAAAALNLLLNFWLIPAHGWLGAAWASLACDGLLGVANLAALLWLTAPGRQPAGRGLHEGASGASSDVRPLPPFSEE